MEKRLDQFQIGANFQRTMMNGQIIELVKKIERLEFVIYLLKSKMCEDCKQKLLTEKQNKNENTI